MKDRERKPGGGDRNFNAAHTEEEPTAREMYIGERLKLERETENSSV